MALACVLGRYGASSCAYGVCLCAFSSGECGVCLCMFCSGAYGVCLCVSYSWCFVPTVLLMLLGQISVVVRICLWLRRYICPSCVRRMYDLSVSAGCMTAGFQRPCSWALTYSPLCSVGSGLDDVS